MNQLFQYYYGNWKEHSGCLESTTKAKLSTVTSLMIHNDWSFQKS